MYVADTARLPTFALSEGGAVVAFVSLMQNEKLEVRLLAGSGARVCEPSTCAPYALGQCDFYGVFTLELERTTP